MLKWLSKSKSRSTKPAPRLRGADVEMQVEAIGRLPQDVAEGGRTPEPAPEYIREAAEPSEDMWAREQERYRRSGLDPEERHSPFGDVRGLPR